MNKTFYAAVSLLLGSAAATAQGFTAGNLVVLQTSGTSSKASSAIVLKEFSTTGTAGITVTLPVTGTNPIQTAGIFGGSEGFLTTSTDNKYLMVGGYGTSSTFSDITATTASSVTRVIGTVAPSGFYMQVAASNTFYSANDIRGAVSDGTSYWASGASVASVDGIDYFGPGTPAALAVGATPPKAYGLRIFNGQIYYSTQKAGPTNTSSQLGIFALGTGKPTSGTVTVSQTINTGSVIPQDFSFSTTGDTCYVAISLNTSAGGIQKWVKSGSTWSLAYTLGTGATNVGAYGVVVDYSGTNPVLYATTFESAGNRVVKIVDNGTAPSATITTLVPATSNVFYKGISFAPVSSGTPLVNLTISADTASEAAASVITVTANASAVLSSAQTLTLNVSGAGITSGDYTLSATTITIPAGSSAASVTFTVKDDILGEGTEIARLAMRSLSSGIALGLDSFKTITIEDNDGNNKPVVKISNDSTTDYIDAGVTATLANPFVLSGVINNPTDPAATKGVSFLITDLETPSAALSFRFSSSDTDIVSPTSGLLLSGTDSIRNLKIIPSKVGYSDITMTVSDGTDSTTYVLQYAASADTVLPAASYWHTGMSDASAAVALDDDYYIAADDEMNILNVYSRKNSGQPFSSFEYSSALALPNPSKPEVDLEAAAPSWVNKGKIYWLGSMSNGKSPFDAKPNRDRIFATVSSGTGSATIFSVAGYAALRAAIISWGDANGYNFTASAAAGVDSKLPSGFAAEGMVFGPDSTTLYIGLRAPLVPVTDRKKALIVPVKNFETWFGSGSPAGVPSFGSPIELNLGGRGIRDMIRLSDGTYVIIAGDAGGTMKGAIYKWSGKDADTAIPVASTAAAKLNMEGVMEVAGGSSLQVLTDNGDDVLYNDGIVSKDFGDLIMRKFRSVVLDMLDLTMPSTSIPYAAVQDSPVQVFPNPASGKVSLGFYTAQQEPYTIRIWNTQGRKVYETSGTTTGAYNEKELSLHHLPGGTYILQLNAGAVNGSQKLVVE